MDIRPAGSGTFVAVISGLELTGEVSDQTVQALDAALARHGVLIFHDQALTNEQQMAFGARFGTLEATSEAVVDVIRRVKPQMADISNLDDQGRQLAEDAKRNLFNLGNHLWHSDSSFRAIPAAASMLSARVVPSIPADTEFADMASAYETLDEATRRAIDGLICEHSVMYSRQQLGFLDFTEDEHRRFAPVRQPMVRRHPSTGRRSLFLSAHAGDIVGWPTPKARVLFRHLIERATQPSFVHAHRWRVGDFVLWDNRQTMHRGAWHWGRGEVRDLRRVTVTGEPALSV